MLSAPLVFAVITVWSVTFGPVHVASDRVAQILWHAITGVRSDGQWDSVVIMTIRLPRALVAAVCGGGLAAAGAAMQGLFRNPMADPGVVGVSSGASLGAVCALYGLSSLPSAYAVPASAFAGAALCGMAVFALASSQGRTPVTTLLLAGVAVSGVASALTSFVLSLSLSEWELGREMLSWLMGTLEGKGWRELFLALPLIVVGVGGMFVYARDLDVLATGEESALSVGVDVERVKRNVLLFAALTTAATVAVIGVVGFVGLMVPHIVRLWIGPGHRRLLLGSTVTGAVFVEAADLLCRVFPAANLRLGVVTALAGGPFFLYLLVRHRIRLEAP